MLAQHQDVILLAQRHQHGPGQRAMPQIEGKAQLPGQHLVQRNLALTLDRRGQLDHAQWNLSACRDDLDSTSVDGVERRPQGLVALGQCVERRAQRVAVERSGEPQPDPRVVLGPTRAQVVQEPQPLLGPGKRQRPFARHGSDPRRAVGNGPLR